MSKARNHVLYAYPQAIFAEQVMLRLLVDASQHFHLSCFALHVPMPLREKDKPNALSATVCAQIARQ
jgi:hypothetical protein